MLLFAMLSAVTDVFSQTDKGPHITNIHSDSASLIKKDSASKANALVKPDTVKNKTADTTSSKNAASTANAKMPTGSTRILKMLKTILLGKPPVRTSAPANAYPGYSMPGAKTATQDTAKKTTAAKPANPAPAADTTSRIQKIISKLDHSTEHGNISAGYDYGVIPFAQNIQVPMGYFHADGQTQFNLGVLPFNASFNYTDLQNISGLSNYYRISFDFQKFSQQYTDKVAQQENNAKNTISQLLKLRQVAEQKLLYLTSLGSGEQVKTPGIPNGSGLPSIPGSGLMHLDSLSQIKLQQTLPTGNRALSDDSVKLLVGQYQNEIAQYDKDIAKLNKLQNTIDNTSKHPSINNPYLSPLYNIMGGMKKFEIGLCYPDYNTFLINGTAIKGMNMEYEKSNIYLAASEGVTVNTLLFSNNSLQNKLVNTQNLYNMFDFNSVEGGRRIVAVKGGVGKKEGTHLYIGMLYGTGLPSYVTSPGGTNPGGLSTNYVLEVDGKWAINKSMSINLVYGKSSLASNYGGYEISDGGLFRSTQNKALSGKYKWNVVKTKTVLTLSGRYVDPFFSSFGLIYLRNDNIRYEAKAEQPLGKKIRLSVFYRKDDDDFLRLYENETVLQTVGANASIKILRSLTVKFGYSPVVEHYSDYLNPVNDMVNYNNISNASLTYAPILHGLTTVFNGSYNVYKLTTDSSTSTFQNFSFNNITRLKNSLTNNLAINWFRTTPHDSLNNNVWEFSEQVGYTFHKTITCTVGGKASYSPYGKSWQLGYLLKVHMPLIKHLSIEIAAEKLVLGDYYYSLNIAQIEQFPYLLQGKIILTW
jgi:hypothetical protein